MGTERIYYHDGYQRDFQARVVEIADDGRRIYLDRTAFYPTSGGQPFDTGELSADGKESARVIDVIDEEERIAHLLDRGVAAAEVAGKIDWPRRFDHMQQHTGQHLLSAVLQKLFEIPTVSFHMGSDVSTIEIGAPSLSAQQMERAEQMCANIVAEARAVTISEVDLATASASDLGLRKPSERTGILRLIAIDDIDRSACGGTHVRRTSEIGAVLIRKIEKLRGNVRLEFVCGGRALRHAKSDFATLQELSRLLCVPAAQTPASVSAKIDREKALEKSAQKLGLELAQLQGRELWAGAAANHAGLKVVKQNGPIDDALRARAQAFAALGKAVFVAVAQDPAAVLLAVSPDSGIHAGERVKAMAVAAGGRGGGNAALAQASLPTGVDLEEFARGLCG